MPTNDYEPHPFINHIPCPPWPKSVHTEALDSVLEQFPYAMADGRQLPNLLPRSIRVLCEDCGFHVPCERHVKVVEFLNDTGIISRQGGKTNNGTGKSDSSDT